MRETEKASGKGNRHGELAPCRSHDVLQRLGEKWTYLTITILSRAEGNWVRASDIKTNIRGISQRMLTVTLRNLERDGMVLRQVHAEMPPPPVSICA
jgi:DNA-binding HxlR family transcriptional regulator